MGIDEESMERSRTIPQGSFSKNFWRYIERVTGRQSLKKFVSQSVLMSMLGGLPSVWSSLARGIIYRKFMGNVGWNCMFERNVQFYIPQRVFLGNNVFIGESSRLDPECAESEIRLEDDVYIGRGCVVRAGWVPPGKIHLHKSVYIGDRSFLYGAGEIEVGKFSTLAYNVSLISGEHGYENASIPMAFQMPKLGKIKIGENVWLGPRTIVTAGVEIGDGCVVMAGSVVTKNAPPRSLVTGIPAKAQKIAYVND